MTNTTLRAYLRDIDNLIEEEKLDEAIAHCRHVLQKHPKYVACYRLLGKAYLEAKRFGDAADIFQRVLSAVPDDFVSHIGMSLVREDEGNLDAAIWHMERAFETNPANPAIQQELKRLIGQRDGFEPHKVRLTRGALARMYAHGELFPQAIAELRSALQEDSDRPDLQVLLADMYWETDQRTEAAEISGEILDKLPYCLKATRIMAAVLQENGKQNKAAAYHRRLAQLDPYLAYTEAPMVDASRIDASSITLEKLSWQPGQPLPEGEAAPADWATSLGLDDDEGGPGTGPLPSWLDDVTTEEPSGQPSAPAFESSMEESEAAGEEAEGSEEIPTWMRDAGWQEASGEAEERPVSFSSEELDALERGEVPAESPPTEQPTTESGELEPAEIPGWLQDMAPRGESDEEETADEELEAILSAQSDRSSTEGGAVSDEPDPGADEPSAVPDQGDEEESGDVPGWLDEGEPGATSTIMTWLSDRDEDAEAAPTSVPESGEEEAAADWLREMGDESSDEPAADREPPEGGDEVPEWLSGVAQAASEPAAGEEEDLARLRRQSAEGASEDSYEEPSDEVPDWIRDITGEEASPASPAAEDEADFAWESEVEAAEGDTVPSKSPDEPDSSAEEAPDWMADFEEEGPLEATEAPAPEGEAAADASAEEEDWVAGLREEPGEGERQAGAASWLEELGSEDPQDQSEQETEVPDWMSGLEEETQEEEEGVEELASGWLDDLSDTLAETPAEPETSDAEEAPDWMTDFGEAEADTAETASAEASESREPEGEPSAAEEDEDLAWMGELADEADLEAETTDGHAADVAELEDLDEDDVFGWLDQMASESEEASARDVEGARQPGDFAEDVDEAPPPESLEEGMEWLEELAETRGIDADVSREPAAGTASERRPSRPEEAASPEHTQESAEPESRRITPEDLDRLSELQAGVPDAEPALEEELPAEREQTAAAPPEPRGARERDDEEPRPEQRGAPAGEQSSEADAPESPSEVGAPPDSEPAQDMEAVEPDREAEPTWPSQPAEPESPEAPPETHLSQARDPSEDPAPEPPTRPEHEPIPDADEDVPDWLQEHATGVALEEEGPEASTEEGRTAPPEADAVEFEPTREKSEQPPREAAVEPGVEAEDAASPAAEPAQAAPEPEPIAPEAGREAEVDREAKVGEAPTPPEPPPAAPAPEPSGTQAPAPAETPEEQEQPGGADVPEPVPAAPAPESLSPQLNSARRALAEQDIEGAAAAYSQLIEDRQEVDAAVEDLEEFLEKGEAPTLWQTLGDGYMLLNRTKDAVRAYSRGMEETEVLDSARQALAAGDTKRATAQYTVLIKKNTELTTVIDDLEQTLESGDGSPLLWQTLGEAYMKAGKVDESIRAYRRGMGSV